MEQLKEFLTEILPASSVLLHLVGWIFSAIALYCIAKKLSVKGAPAAFFPIANVYLLGGISDKCAAMRGQKKPQHKFWLLFSMWMLIIIIPIFLIAVTIYTAITMGIMFFALIHAIGGSSLDLDASPNVMEHLGTLALIVIIGYVIIRIFSLAFTFSKALALNRIYAVATPRHAVLFTLLSLFPLADGLILFCVRNKVRIIEPKIPKRAEFYTPDPTAIVEEETPAQEPSTPATESLPTSSLDEAPAEDPAVSETVPKPVSTETPTQETTTPTQAPTPTDTENGEQPTETDGGEQPTDSSNPQ